MPRQEDSNVGPSHPAPNRAVHFIPKRLGRRRAILAERPDAGIVKHLYRRMFRFGVRIDAVGDSANEAVVRSEGLGWYRLPLPGISSRPRPGDIRNPNGHQFWQPIGGHD